MPEVDEPLQALSLGAASGGHNDAVEVFAVQCQAAFGLRREVTYGRLKPDVDAQPLGFAGEAIDDGLGVVGGGEHASVLLRLELDAAKLKPRDRVGGLEGGEGFFQVLAAAWVVLGERGR